mmetsp:Transcript_10659/g.16323  ORF Transcript_10659/g.16323 Transcript_10659/m.16323 type:complete len:91 (-) Transcript_10659:189-461(-)
MNLLIFLAATIAVTSALPFLRQLDSDSCSTQCQSRIVRETLTSENVDAICLEARFGFQRDYDECMSIMTSAVDLGQDEATNQLCAFMCET